MDAKPQRPPRIMRDENVPLALPANKMHKAVHSRHKSSPALISVAGLGINMTVVKRPAFGDVSSSVIANRLVRDALVAHDHVKAELLEKSVPAQQANQLSHDNYVVQGKTKDDVKVKVEPLKHRAQRSLSIADPVTGLKNLLNNVTNASALMSKTTIGESKQPAPAVTSRKFVIKKSNAIYRDVDAPKIIPDMIGDFSAVQPQPIDGDAPKIETSEATDDTRHVTSFVEEEFRALKQPLVVDAAQNEAKPVLKALCEDVSHLDQSLAHAGITQEHTTAVTLEAQTVNIVESEESNQHQPQSVSLDLVTSSSTTFMEGIVVPIHNVEYVGETEHKLRSIEGDHVVKAVPSDVDSLPSTVPTPSSEESVLADVDGASTLHADDIRAFQQLRDNADLIVSSSTHEVNAEVHNAHHHQVVVTTVESSGVEINHKPALPDIQEQEFWDDEDDEVEDEGYDEDGYVTARSFRSRGDNTTGGTTTIRVPKLNLKVRRELSIAKTLVESTRSKDDVEEEIWDISMVAEYSEDIFKYMKKLETKMQPNAYYMDCQTEIQWSMRSVLMDWVVQVHARFNLLPETLHLAVNCIDRFLSRKIVSLGKVQLVGAIAILVAAKYEEINCPSVSEIVYMVDNGYTVDEILKAERYMLSMLQFELGWPGPMNFLRKISKADDYDLETRTLAKYFLEITIMDERFLACTPSYSAAAAHCLSRMMLGKGIWSPHHVYYSGYAYVQIYPLLKLMMACCRMADNHHKAIYDKYSAQRYKRCSCYAEKEISNGFRLIDPDWHEYKTFVDYYDCSHEKSRNWTLL